MEFDNLPGHERDHPPVRAPRGPGAPKTEEDMFLLIFEYIDRIFNAVRPHKLLFMAIDGRHRRQDEPAALAPVQGREERSIKATESKLSAPSSPPRASPCRRRSKRRASTST